MRALESGDEQSGGRPGERDGRPADDEDAPLLALGNAALGEKGDEPGEKIGGVGETEQDEGQRRAADFSQGFRQASRWLVVRQKIADRVYLPLRVELGSSAP